MGEFLIQEPFMFYGVVIPVGSLPIASPMETEYLILPEYTNAAIDAQIVGRMDPWAQAMSALRSVPANWRQSVWTAAHASVGHGKDLADLNAALVAQVDLFHAGERPARLETPRP